MFLMGPELWNIHYAAAMGIKPGTRWRSWLRYCSTSLKVTSSIPEGVIGIFHWHNPSGRTMARRSSQPVKEMSTRNISWGVKEAGVWGWQPYHIPVPIVLKSGSLNLLEPSGPVQACTGTVLPFLWVSITVLNSYNNNDTYYRNPPILFYEPTALVPRCDHTNITWIFSLPGSILDINGVSEGTLLRRQVQVIVKILYGNRHYPDITSP